MDTRISDGRIDVFSAVVAAVTIAKNMRIRSVSDLRSQLECEGYCAREIDGAIEIWSGYVKDRGMTGLRAQQERSWG